MLEDSISNFRLPIGATIQGNAEVDSVTLSYTLEKVRRLIEDYASTSNNEILKKLIYNDTIHVLREYHKFSVKRKIGAHYFEVTDKDTTFEHIIPMHDIGYYVLGGVITPEEACVVPTCQLSKDHDKVLTEMKFRHTTPNAFQFWERYTKSFENATFITHDGQPVNTDMTLQDHFDWVMA